MNIDNIVHVMCHLSLWENSCYWFVVSYQKKTKKKKKKKSFLIMTIFSGM